ncbi:TMAO reductase sytem sensor TorS [Afipia felis]|uniref:TMAO reductase sytem sensor TorS n=2 Tax=Afipia felis TaxID=1035 RepID=A0A090MKA5_AFIFE|nr:TMAO reductase sytem sensor TorS [Afipia felis]
MKAVLSKLHFGLRGRLFMAFGLVAALTVIASLNAIFSYVSLGNSLGVIAEQSLPELTRSSSVIKAAGDVGAAAPSLLAAANNAERSDALKALAAAREEMKHSIGLLSADDAAKLNGTAGRILVNLTRLEKSVTERQSIAEARHALIGELRKTHQKLAEN